MTRVEELKRHAERAIAARKAEKSVNLAFLVWSFSIPSQAMESATEAEWMQLVDAARANTGRDYALPSLDSRKLILAEVRRMETEQRRIA